MDDRRKKIIEIILAVVVIVALIILIIFLLKKPSDEDRIKQSIREMPTAEEIFTADEILNPEILPDTTARIFVERFGSFSTESNFNNIDDVIDLVTPELATDLQSLKANSPDDFGDEYYGVSTRILTIELISQTASQVEMTVSTQREEAFNNPGNTSIRNQDIDLTLVKSGQNWLVSSYEWK